MSDDRVKCQAEGCENTILLMTAARTGGICMRCENKRLQAEREDYIRRNRRNENPYAGLSSQVDVILTYHTPRKHDPLVVYLGPPQPIEQLYASLSYVEREQLAHRAIEARNTGNEDLAHDLARALACFTDHDLSNLAVVWIQNGDLWPSVLFRGANAAVRDQILSIVRAAKGTRADSLSLNHALCALAWIGDEVVQECFSMWEQNPPIWRSSLHVGPQRYARTGGWELTDQGRRDLYHPACWALVPQSTAATDRAAVVAFDSTEGQCPWCQRNLAMMLKIETADPRFAFLGWSGRHLDVLSCEVCTCYSEAIFAKIDMEGDAHWHAANQKPSYLPDLPDGDWAANPWHGVHIELSPRPPRQASEYVSELNASQVGGYPCWVQDTAYPQCPDCEQTMMFIAQLDNNVFSGYEGTYYAFLCRSCRVTATSYQQT